MSRKQSSSSDANRFSRTGQVSSASQRTIACLDAHTINTLTALTRVESHLLTLPRSSPDFQPLYLALTRALTHYVTSHSLLTELRTLTPRFPICAEIVADAYERVAGAPDAETGRSWNLAWLVLCRMRDDGLVGVWAEREAARREMWDGERGAETAEERRVLLEACFEREWRGAIARLLRHWRRAPVWE